MILPDGQIFTFYETRTNYTIEFADDTDTIYAIRKSNPDALIFKGQLVNRSDRATLRNPVQLTWDLAHDRFCHFNPERIVRSKDYITGIDIASLGTPSRHKICPKCVEGSFRGHRKGTRTKGTFTRFAQRIYSDTCEMPKSTPFAFIEMYIFYDACTKHIGVYYECVWPRRACL